MAKRNPPIFLFLILWAVLMTAFFGLLYPREFRLLTRKIQQWLVKSPPTRQPHRNLSSFGVAMPPEYTIHGLDVSHYQEAIDWQAVKAMQIGQINLQFVFIKATEGATYQDTYFANNWQTSKQVGLIRGAYHYFRPLVNAQSQAENFIRTVKLESGDLPPVLDIEELGDQTPENLQKALKIWLNLVEKQYKIQPIIYTNRNFYQTYLKDEFKTYRFWLAQYKASKLLVKQSNWLFWQHTDRGLVNGMVGYTDLNIFKGSWNDLQKICLP